MNSTDRPATESNIDAEAEYLFVYGTLRRDSGSAMHDLLAKHAQPVGKGVYRGRLYRIDWYPGAVPSDDPDETVHGEIYLMQHPELILPQLDRYEETGPDFPEPHEYVRRRQPVRLLSGECLSAWIYLYNRPVDSLMRISSGDFLRER